jgi:hypothetical protein
MRRRDGLQGVDHPSDRNVVVTYLSSYRRENRPHEANHGGRALGSPTSVAAAYSSSAYKRNRDPHHRTRADVPPEVAVEPTVGTATSQEIEPLAFRRLRRAVVRATRAQKASEPVPSAAFGGRRHSGKRIQGAVSGGRDNPSPSSTASSAVTRLLELGAVHLPGMWVSGKHQQSWLRGDLLAGVMVAAYLVPEGWRMRR